MFNVSFSLFQVVVGDENFLGIKILNTSQSGGVSLYGDVVFHQSMKQLFGTYVQKTIQQNITALW